MPRRRDPDSGGFKGHHTKEYEGRRRANDTPDRAGQKIPPVRPSTSSASDRNRDSAPKHDRDARPATPRAPRKTTPRKAASSARSSPSPAVPTRAPGSAGRERSRTARTAEAAHSYANRQAYRATHGKPSTTGRALSGAAAGTAAGAAIGGPVGAAVGAGVGGVGGAVAGHTAKKAYKAAMRTNGKARRIIVVEFALCAVIVALSPLTDEKKDEKPGHWMKRMTAVMALFFLLGLVSAAGAGAARVAAGFGGIVTVVLAVSERNLFTKITEVFASDKDQPASGTGPPDEAILDEVAPERVGRVGDL